MSTDKFWGRCPRFEFSISDNESGALQDHCVLLYNLRIEGGGGGQDIIAIYVLIQQKNIINGSCGLGRF